MPAEADIKQNPGDIGVSMAGFRMTGFPVPAPRQRHPAEWQMENSRWGNHGHASRRMGGCICCETVMSMGVVSAK